MPVRVHDAPSIEDTFSADNVFEAIDSARRDLASLTRGEPLLNRDEDFILKYAQQSRKHAAYAKEALTFINAVMKGKTRVSGMKLFEAMSTSDFSHIFSAVIDRMMLASFRATPQVWRAFVKINTVDSFRTSDRIDLFGSNGEVEEVGEGANYPAASVTDRKYSLSVKKYGRRFPLTMETIVNDDMGALRDLPVVIARDIAHRLNRYVTSLYAANATLYSTTHTESIVNGVTVTASNKGTGALNEANLEIGIGAMTSFKGDDNNPVLVDPRYLVVAPQKRLSATKLLTQIQATASGDVNVVAMQGLELIVDPYLPLVDTVQGTTGWYLFTEPIGREYAIEVAFLRGHEEPQLFRKTGNAAPVGGSALVPEASFENDTIEYKGRHIWGGAAATAIGNWRFTYWSTGVA